MRAAESPDVLFATIIATVSLHLEREPAERSLGNEVSSVIGAGLGARETVPFKRSARMVGAEGGNTGREFRGRTGKKCDTGSKEKSASVG